MAISLVQTKSQNGGGYVNSYTVTLSAAAGGADVTAGNTLILFLTAGSADIPDTITDDKSNTWTLAESNENERESWQYYAFNVAGGATVITIGFQDGQFSDSCCQVREYSGLTTTDPLDVVESDNSSTNFVNSHSSGASASTNQANELVVGQVGSSGDASPVYVAGTGYGNLVQQNGFDAFTYQAIEDKTVSATGAQTATFTSTGFIRSQTIVATYKEASAGSAVKTVNGLAKASMKTKNGLAVANIKTFNSL